MERRRSSIEKKGKDEGGEGMGRRGQGAWGRAKGGAGIAASDASCLTLRKHGVLPGFDTFIQCAWDEHTL